MDQTNKLFQILHELNQKNLFFEKTHIVYEREKELIKKKDCTKKELEKTYIFVEIELETKEKLIIKEKPSSFFQAYSIFLGDSTKLIKAKEQGTNQEYFFEKRDLEELKKIITFKEIREIPPQALHKKTYTYPIKELEIITEIKKYSKEFLSLDLNTIHIVKHNRLELFVPTVHEKHNLIAHKLNIPIQACIKNNYFYNTTIHVQDETKQKELLKPILEKKEKEFSYIFNKKEIEKVLQTQLYIKLNKEEIINKINSIEHTNIDIEKIFEIIRTKKEVLIGNKHGKILLPMFKHREYKTFENKEKFKQEVGLEYKSNSDFLTSLKVRKLVNTDYKFKEYYLNKTIENIVESKEAHIYCKSLNEILVVLSTKINPKTITLEEQVNMNQIKELTKHIFSLAKFTITKSVSNNYLPKEKRAQNAIEHYFLSKSSKLMTISREYTKKHSKKELLKQTLQTAQEISELNKTLTIEKESLYFLHQCILLYLEILTLFNKEKAHIISITLEEYFGSIPLKLQQSKINKKNDTIIKQIVLLHKISRKKNCLINIKQKIYSQYYPKNIPILPSTKTDQKIYYRANIIKLKEISPYNYNTIAKTINGTILPKNIKIQKKEISCSNEFYFKTIIHNEYKEVLSNEVFSLFVKEE